MITRACFFENLEEAWDWTESLRAEYPDCIDYVEVRRSTDGYHFSMNIYTELKRDKSPMGREVPTEEGS